MGNKEKNVTDQVVLDRNANRKNSTSKEGWASNMKKSKPLKMKNEIKNSVKIVKP